MLIPSRWCS